ncbi:jg2271 [Pararge aegeria aegeria]|uniref:Jg2271 protein n=1 Tax=Pararge aegeria aegeria TaxID=348720 RepID=A0A8S4RRY1_9NEOP|nr:jg2271 [Pararge aegeria aegeria]
MGLIGLEIFMVKVDLIMKKKYCLRKRPACSTRSGVATLQRSCNGITSCKQWLRLVEELAACACWEQRWRLAVRPHVTQTLATLQCPLRRAHHNVNTVYPTTIYGKSKLIIIKGK